MNRKRWIIVLSIFLIAVFIVGYKVLNNQLERVENPKNIVNDTTHNLRVDEYKNSSIQEFKANITKKYPNIKSIILNSQQVDLHFQYTVNNDLSKEESNQIFEETKIYLKQDSFQKSIMKECNREAFFHDIYVHITNPKTTYRLVFETSNFKSNNADNCKWDFIDVGNTPELQQ